MFFFLALAATLGYSLQSALMAACYRSMDQLSAVAMRGLSIGIAMSPLLFFVPWEDFTRLPEFLPSLLLASALTTIANVFSAQTYGYLSVGVATALSMCMGTICTAILGYVALEERFNPSELFFIALLLLGTLALGSTRSHGPLPRAYDAKKGLRSSILFGIFIAGGYYFVGTLSRQTHPFLVGYCWELFIGLIAANLAFVRGLTGRTGLTCQTKSEFRKILLSSSPTVMGTGCYAMATSLGPLGIVSALLTSMMLWNSLLGALIYGEKLTRQQWLLLAFIAAALVGLKLAG